MIACLHQRELVLIIQKEVMSGQSRLVVLHLITVICVLNNSTLIQLVHLQTLKKVFAEDML